MAGRLSATEKEIILEIDANKLMEYNTEISKEVRLSGSEEELRAFKYAKKALESFGLETKLTFHDAYISLPGKAKLLIGDIKIPCITHSMAPSTKAGGLIGTPVYVGGANFDLTFSVGSIAIVEGIASPGILSELENAGAIGAIFINGDTHMK